MLKPVLKSLGISKDAKTITLQDATGAYDATTNPGGYGVPNALAPSIIGMRWRYWADDTPFANIATKDATIVSGLLSGLGYPFKYETLGLPAGAFPSGVYQLKYYPFESTNTVISLTQDSRVITVTAGTAPNTWSTDYVAVVLLNGANLVSKVLMIDRTQTISATEFSVDEAWAGASVAGYGVAIATEADLKVMFTQLAEACIAGRIGELPSLVYCDSDTVDMLTRFTMWKFSADVKFQCKDYSGAHNLIVSAEKECRGCDPGCGCKSCPS